MKTPARSALVLATALSMYWSGAAFSAPSRVGEIATKTVRFADLDISTADGAQELYERIVAAARAVCRDAGARFVYECRTRAVADAVRGVGSPLLTSVHRSTVDRVEEVVRR
jgi:UrcA family protein